MSLIPKVCITLNLLRKSHINPKLLAPAQLHGVFDFNATPLAPLGKKCLLHEKPGSRGSWEVRAINIWYVNRAKDNYRCYQVIPEKTKMLRISDTVESSPTDVRCHSDQHQKNLQLN